jgi:hypothetical protein
VLDAIFKISFTGMSLTLKCFCVSSSNRSHKALPISSRESKKNILQKFLHSMEHWP